MFLKYRLDYGDQSMPLGALYDADSYDDYVRRFAIMHPLIETERYLFIKYTTNREFQTIENYAVYDKRENKILAHQSDSEGMVSERYPALTFWPRYTDNKGRIIGIHEPDSEDENFVLSVISLK